MRETPKDIGIDEFMAMAGPDGRDYLDELAVKGYEGMMHVEQLEEIQNRINDKDYLPISINIESLLLREEKDAYIFRVPRGRTREVSSRAIRVKKEDCILLDEGQTVITCLDRQEDIFGYALDNRENPDFSEAVKLDVKELEKILTDSEEMASFLLGSKHILFQVGAATLGCRLLEGEFLDWRRVVPTDCPIKLIASVSDLASSVERVGLIVSEKYKSPVRCVFGNNELLMRTNTTIGAAEDKCAFAGDGKELEIGFNVRYLADALRVIPSEEVTLELTNGLSPIVMNPCDGSERYSYMVLPVRLKAGE